MSIFGGPEEGSSMPRLCEIFSPPVDRECGVTNERRRHWSLIKASNWVNMTSKLWLYLGILLSLPPYGKVLHSNRYASPDRAPQLQPNLVSVGSDPHAYPFREGML